MTGTTQLNNNMIKNHKEKKDSKLMINNLKQKKQIH